MTKTDKTQLRDMKTVNDAQAEFAFTALLANQMIEDKKICPLHHGFWVRKMEEELEGIKGA